MPTFLRVYSNNQSNPMLRKTIEYCCRQFFILHRIPFILQMLGSIAQLIDFDEQIDVININKIQSISVVRLLIALEQTSFDAMRDDYSILELVMNDSLPTKTVNAPPATDMTGVAALGQGIMMAPTIIESLDFCYTNDETTFTLLSCFDVCVTVGKLIWKTMTIVEISMFIEPLFLAHEGSLHLYLIRLSISRYYKSKKGLLP